MSNNKSILNNKVILITGGTGSFGKQFVQHVLKNFSPKKVIIFSRDELKQFEMEKELKNKSLRFFIGDVRDQARLSLACQGVDIIIHAAALKHVKIAEYNPQECIKTNINGAENVIFAALKNKVEKVIALSTDKASNPINLYGATKLVSDKLFIAANNLIGQSKTRFGIVRYGNVLNSRGSLITLILDSIKKRKKTFPITDVRMTRFFMSLEDSVKFTIKSLNYMRGGEIFIPKLPSLRIIDLVKYFDSKIKFKIIGKKPGEKIHETLFSNDESENIVEYKDFYILEPEIIFTTRYKKKINEKKILKNNKVLKSGFLYSSKNNKNFLNLKDIGKLVNSLINNSDNDYMV